MYDKVEGNVESPDMCTIVFTLKHAHFRKSQTEISSVGWWLVDTNPVSEQSTRACDIRHTGFSEVAQFEANSIISQFFAIFSDSNLHIEHPVYKITSSNYQYMST